MNIIQLNVHISIGSLPDTIFQYIPRLITLNATGINFTKDNSIKINKNDYEGPISINEYDSNMKNIEMTDLLVLMNELYRDAMVITDRKGTATTATITTTTIIITTTTNITITTTTRWYHCM